MKRLSEKMDVEDEYNPQKRVNLVESSPIVNNLSLNTANCFKTSNTDLIQLATEIQKADTFVHANACNKLQVISEQIRFLQKQAESILLKTKIDADMHHAACNFVKVPGNIYHLYRRGRGQNYLSMISPNEWNSPHEFLGSYRLESDQSWTPSEYIKSKDVDMELLNTVLEKSQDVNVLKSLNWKYEFNK